MDLKPGQISEVIADANGFFIYKLKGKDTLPLDQAHDEIKATMRSQRMQDAMQAVQQSVTLTFDENYFGPEMPARGPMMPTPGNHSAPRPPNRPRLDPSNGQFEANCPGHRDCWQSGIAVVAAVGGLSGHRSRPESARGFVFPVLRTHRSGPRGILPRAISCC